MRIIIIIKKYIKYILPLIFVFVFTECGSPGVNVNNAPYEPKIAVEAYLYCGETVKDIRLMRNFPLGAPLDKSTLYLTPAGNNVSVTINGTPLNFNPQTFTYYNNAINIGYDKTYKLEVFASIDGKNLHASSTTTTPQKGFEVLKKYLGNIKYNTASPVVSFKTSPGTDYYIFSIVPDSASTSNFIYENALRSNQDSAKVAKDLNDLKFRSGSLNNIDSYSGQTYSFIVQLYQTWFYGPYTLIAYAGDTNFKDYVMTAPSVQEFDGNFHEPIQIFNGDGIGVFASAIRDTVKFTIIK